MGQPPGWFFSRLHNGLGQIVAAFANHIHHVSVYVLKLKELLESFLRRLAAPRFVPRSLQPKTNSFSDITPVSNLK
jgi:hypothetical protein